MMSWKSLSRLLSGIKGAYNDINPSTLTGAIDVVVVEQPDGSFTCGPFHVRFGKLTAIAPTDKAVEIYVNGHYVDFIQMRLGSAGNAYFVDADASSSNVDRHGQLQSYETELLHPPWPSSKPRRRRRRLRRDTANSEPDATNLDFDLLDDRHLQSDCEDSHLDSVDCNPLVGHCVSESYLSDKCTSSEDINWDWSGSPHRRSIGVMSSATALNKDLKVAQISNSNRASFSSKNKPDGIYLEDLVASEVDQTVKEAYIYPPTHTRIYHSMPPGYGGPSEGIDAGYRSDGEHSPRSLSPIYPSVFGLRLSLCGCPPSGSQVSDEKFLDCLVSYEEFIKDPESILANPNLMLHLNGKYLVWPVAAPSIVSVLAFQTELPHRAVRHLEDVHMRKKESRRTSWFSWGARVPEVPRTSVVEDRNSEASALPKVDEQYATNKLTTEIIMTASENTELQSDSKEQNVGQLCNQLSSEDIVRLQLKPGRNDVEFHVTTKYQGTCICSASIYLWHWSDRVVVSDVDGTITRSDVLGHLLPMLGHDWTHTGVARLYNQIARNGYRFLYLSTRALGQAGITRSYLRQVVQEAGIALPDGPILLSPNSLFHAIHQEVIEKKPENFKIQCLSDFCSLFPKSISPLYAGFGNKVNDVYAYEQSGIERCRIFRINPRGEVRNQYHPTKVTSYTELSLMSDYFFPVNRRLESKVDPIQPIVNEPHVDSSVYPYTQSSDNDNVIPVNRISATPDVDLSVYSSFTFWRNLDYRNFPPHQA